jgi:DNA-binding winged helix-turn-helix (wHTH) protein/TolB-like protein/Tfp pilus assembly protein PilF
MTDQHRAPDRGQPVRDRSAAAGVVCIGDWRAEASLNLLCRGDRQVRLEPRMMDLLLLLAQSPGEVFPREALLAQLWDGLVVGDDALTQVVVKLRKVLGDDPRSPSYIQTVPKRGYRLIAPIGAADALMAEPGGDTPPRARGPTLIVGAAIVTMMIVVAVVLLAPRPDGLPAPSDRDATALKAAVDQGSGTVAPLLAIMPFDVIGDHPGQRYLAEGLATELALDLSRLSDLKVIRVDSSRDRAELTARGHADPVLALRGAVQLLPEQIAVEISLLDEGSGHELWSERYYRPFGDLFALRDEIEAKIAAALSLRIGEVRQAQDARRYSGSVAAYDAFLQARGTPLTGMDGQHYRALDLYREAIRLDGAFARAYAGLALTYTTSHRNRSVDDGPTALRRAAQMAREALRIDPALAEANWVLGYVDVQQRKHATALVHLDRALAAAPDYADALALKAAIKTHLGEPRASIPLLRQAMRLRPSASYVYYLALGRACYFLGDFVQARVNLAEALARNPADLEAHIYLAAVLAVLDDREGAAWEAEEIRSLAPDFSAVEWLRTYPMTARNELKQLGAALAELAL